MTAMILIAILLGVRSLVMTALLISTLPPVRR